jgi:CheY-like chemotaxis protein
MSRRTETVTILLADDDPVDAMLACDALAESRLCNEVRTVANGEELMDYLYRRGKYGAPGAAPRPGIVLVDLKMPRKNGFEAITEMRADPDLRRIPIVVLTTSQAEADIARSYDLGVNSFISKPVTFDGLVEAMKVLGRYWFQIVELPSGDAEGMA